MLAAGQSLVRHFDLVGVTERMSSFVVLLCELIGVRTCPRFVSRNVNHARASVLSTRFPSAATPTAARHVYRMLAPTDALIYSEVQRVFDEHERVAAARIEAYDRSPPDDSPPARWPRQRPHALGVRAEAAASRRSARRASRCG